MDKIEKMLEAANGRLKSSNAGIIIFRRGKKLSLRGMLPPKPNSKQNKSSQSNPKYKLSYDVEEYKSDIEQP
ncbi:MAG: hypothetical protein AAGA80_21845 [Cyanobacteria bacterium P01_F01_bin.143]